MLSRDHAVRADSLCYPIDSACLFLIGPSKINPARQPEYLQADFLAHHLPAMIIERNLSNDRDGDVPRLA